MADLAQVLVMMGIPAAFLGALGYLNRRSARLHPPAAPTDKLCRDAEAE